MAGRAPVIRLDGRWRQLPAGDWLPISAGGTGATDAPTALGNLGGQPLHANLTAFSGVTGSAGAVFYFTAAGAGALASSSVFGRSMWNAADQAAGRSLLGIGTAGTLNVYTTTPVAFAIPQRDTNNYLTLGRVFPDFIVNATQPTGNGGARVQLEVGGNATISPTNRRVMIDISINQFRVYESGDNARGVYVDLTTCANSAGSTLWHSGNFDPASKQDALGYTPVQQGTGVGQLNNNVKIGWSAGGLLLTVDSTDFANNWPISVSKNAATATKLATARNINGVAFDGTANITVADSTRLLRTGDTLTGPLYGPSTGVIGDATAAKATLQAFGSGVNGAFIALHRSGVYAAYFGIDTDNKLKVGGWSMGNNAYEIWHQNNFDPGTKADLTGATFTGAVFAPSMRTTGAAEGLRVQAPAGTNIAFLTFYDNQATPQRAGFVGKSDTGANVRLHSDLGEVLISRTGINILLSDSAGSTLGGIPKAATPAAETETTQLATTAFVQTARVKAVETSSSPAYMLVLADKNKYKRMTAAGAKTVTVPPNSSVAFPVGSEVDIERNGAGTLTLVAGAGVTLRSPEALTIAKQYGVARVKKVATDEWVVMGYMDLL